MILILILLLVLVSIASGVYWWVFMNEKINCLSDEYLDTTSQTCIKEPYPKGTSVKCKTNDPLKAPDAAVYRYMGNKTIRHYPNPVIASSWNKEWNKNIKTITDCSEYTHGVALAKK